MFLLIGAGFLASWMLYHVLPSTPRTQIAEVAVEVSPPSPVQTEIEKPPASVTTAMPAPIQSNPQPTLRSIPAPTAPTRHVKPEPTTVLERYKLVVTSPGAQDQRLRRLNVAINADGEQRVMTVLLLGETTAIRDFRATTPTLTPFNKSGGEPTSE